MYRPDVPKSSGAGKTGCVEFLSETYHHSLSHFYPKEEFIRQIDFSHKVKIKNLPNQRQRFSRNTELIWSIMR
ncbi:MAG: hypothetical protein IPJ20_02755 [Flammeovirgaceae bacterium]|nr:hypothetical protein [Flammeovirgaceae bacterium]